jgi:hypothetical protein
VSGEKQAVVETIQQFWGNPLEKPLPSNCNLRKSSGRDGYVPPLEGLTLLVELAGALSFLMSKTLRVTGSSRSQHGSTVEPR